MINIISKSYLSSSVSGPQKVVRNLIKGLEILKYPYIINQRLDACQRLWIHDDDFALTKLKDLPSEIKVVAGPNLYILPRHVPRAVDLSRAIWLHPSDWAKDFWIKTGFNRCPIAVWPAGIDTYEFVPSVKEKKIVLIYFKQRFPEELQIVEQELTKRKILYKKIVYNHYIESEFKQLLEETKYIVWIGRQESQGIALQEALSTNIPMLVWDVKNIGHWLASKKEMAIFNKEENDFVNTSSAPYFDSRCGVKIKEAGQLGAAVDIMETTWNQFSPRQYIVENLSLEKQAKDLLMIYENYFSLSLEAGYDEKKIKKGQWRNNLWWYRLFVWFKSVIKKIKNLPLLHRKFK